MLVKFPSGRYGCAHIYRGQPLWSFWHGRALCYPCTLAVERLSPLARAELRAASSRRPRVRRTRNVAHAYADIGRALVRLLPPLVRAAITALKDPPPTRRYLS